MKNEKYITDLIGKTISSITGKVGDDEILLTLETGEMFKMFHDQDCCESVFVEDIEGDLNDLIGSPVTMAEEVTNSDDTFGKIESPDSFTWTFYKLATVKGYVTIRWLGESNGYYSESVSFVQLTP